MARWLYSLGLLGAAVGSVIGHVAGCGAAAGDKSFGSESTTAGAGAGNSGNASSNGVGFVTTGGPGSGSAGTGIMENCPGGGMTTVTGTVFEPAGNVPLYNVVVYVPSAPLDPIPDGSSCDKCGSTLSGSPIVTALTGTDGKFVLEHVPAGNNVPLVIQVGKWRKEITMPTVTACTDNPVPDPTWTRLPRNQSEGHIPKIALTTGGADPLECLLPKIGLDPAEFTLETGPGRVNLYSGWGGSFQYANGGVPFPQSTALWGDVNTLRKYDIVLLACEGSQNAFSKPPNALQALFEYTLSGGRVFASHWHNYWIEAGPQPWPGTATFNHQPDLPDPITALVDMSFPKGQAMAEWLVNVGGSTTLGQIVISAGQHTVDAVNVSTSRRWIYLDAPTSVQYYTFNTPIGVPPEEQCGRVVFSDIHVSSQDQTFTPFPSGCTSNGLSPQEKALLFMLFDLSSCIQDDDVPPVPPPT